MIFTFYSSFLQTFFAFHCLSIIHKREILVPRSVEFKMLAFIVSFPSKTGQLLSMTLKVVAEKRS